MSNALEAIERGVVSVNKNWRALFRALLVPVGVYLIISNLIPHIELNGFAIHVASVLFQLAFTVIAVTTHRIIILGADSVPCWGINRFGWREVKFLLSQYVIFIFLIPLAILFFIPVAGTLAAMVIGAYMVGRMSLVFPSIAIGRKFDFKDSWDATRNHQLMMFLTVAVFPFAIGILKFMLGHVPGVGLILHLFSILTSIWVIGALSVAYQIILQSDNAC